VKSLFLAALAGAAISAHAGILVPDRSTLSTILGASAVTEGFEAYSITAGSATDFGATLDATTVLNGQGPGLVVPGVSFSTAGPSLQLDASGYFGAPSNELLSNSNGLTIDFSSPQQAFGVDLRDFAGYLNTATVIVYAANNTTVLDTYSNIGLGGTPVFFGYENSSGIGSVFLTGTEPWSPIIDNVEFGSVAGAAPEPSTIMMLLGGAGVVALARKRKSA